MYIVVFPGQAQANLSRMRVARFRDHLSPPGRIVNSAVPWQDSARVRNFCKCRSCCYEIAMPSNILLQAISRLDQAVVRAESACDGLLAQQGRALATRNDAISAAIQEIDSLMNSLRASANPGEQSDG